jgi:hypothetical protein
MPPPPGGIAAVSSGVGVTVLLLLGLLLINWLLRGAALRHGLLTGRFRRAHSWLTVTCLVWIVGSEIWFTRAYAAGAAAFYQAMTVLGVVGAPLLPLQPFFAGSALAFFTGNPIALRRRGSTSHCHRE